MMSYLSCQNISHHSQAVIMHSLPFCGKGTSGVVIGVVPHRTIKLGYPSLPFNGIFYYTRFS